MSAATAVSPIDLKAQGSYNVRLGASVLNTPKAVRFTSIRYNHKPQLDRRDEVKYTLRNTDEEESLILQDGENEYEYTGGRVGGEGWYVLVKKNDEQDKVTTLERIDACHDFNLTRTPAEDSSSKLATRFQQLPIDDDDALFGEDDEDQQEPVDLSNPWDYRNHIKKSTAKTKPAPVGRESHALPSTSVPPRAATSTPASRPAKSSSGPLLNQKKRKAPAATKAEPKRPKADTEPPEPSVQSTSKPKPNVPQVRIDRKASMRRPSLDDSGELILENETPVSEKPPKRTGAMALALAGALGQGPISLRSAASSPASRVESPMPPRPDGMDEAEEFELGESPEQISKRPAQQGDDDYFGNDDANDNDDDDDADADVEDLELPSPAQTHRKSVSAATVSGTVDDEDDLDKQLALAMAEDDDSVAPPPPRPAESDEESEEE